MEEGNRRIPANAGEAPVIPAHPFVIPVLDTGI
jgi:hypothetical protein